MFIIACLTSHIIQEVDLSLVQGIISTSMKYLDYK